MTGIQYVTAENIGKVKKDSKKEEEIAGRKYNVRICYAGRPQQNSKAAFHMKYSLLWRSASNRPTIQLVAYNSMTTQYSPIPGPPQSKSQQPVMVTAWIL